MLWGALARSAQAWSGRGGPTAAHQPLPTADGCRGSGYAADVEEVWGCGPKGCIGPGMCGGPMGMCFEAESSHVHPNWNYVGQGRGGYEAVKSFNFVGDGLGSFQREDNVTYHGWRPRRYCIGVFVACILASIACFAIAIVEAPQAVGFGRDVEDIATKAVPKSKLIRVPSYLLPEKCESKCTLPVRTATCKEHVRWATAHVSPGAAVCRKAHDFVLARCPSCADCPLEGTSCDEDAT